MSNRENYLNGFFEEFGYPKEARDSLLRAAKLTEGRPEIEKYLKEYRETGKTDHGKALDEAGRLAGTVGLSPYETQFLLYLLLSEPLLDRYRAAGISRDIWHDSMDDLRCKLFECYRMYGIWGSFVAAWFPRFFEMTRFALGRLQFENYDIDEDYPAFGLKKGDTVVNMHIPSRGKLPHEAVTDSYKRAYDFYPQYRRDGVLPLFCHSWLLYPRHEEFLPEGSNILAFQRDFDITRWGESKVFDDAWRVYYADAGKKPEDLPTDTPLRAAYTAWLRQGNRSGWGQGFILFDGKTVIKQ